MGALQGIKIIELVGLGPGPFAGMMLADMGAEVIAIDRLDTKSAPSLPLDLNRRGKKSIILDLKSPEGRDILLDLCEGADALLEGYRPGVMEKMGLGPEDCMARNPKLVYGRMTGWGQDGPLAQAAGHDINYSALSGALYSMGPPDRPPSVPLNLVGDYGGGAMMLVYGMVCALLHTRNGGPGQIVDAAMSEGASLMMSLFHSLNASGMWHPARGHNFLDGGAPFYDCYETRDGKYISIGAIELPFMKILVEKARLPHSWLANHMEGDMWPERKTILTDLFLQRDQAHWCDLLEGTDACFAPVLPFWEAHKHPHHRARKSFIQVDGVRQPAPTPRLTRTPSEVRWGPAPKGQHTREILQQLGLKPDKIDLLKQQDVIHMPPEKSSET